MVKRRAVQEDKKEPVHVVGPYSTGSAMVEVAVWENPGEERPVYGISINRSYFDAGEKKWKQSKTLRVQDIPALCIALQQAFVWIQDKMNG